jgi:hypothetical protein
VLLTVSVGINEEPSYLQTPQLKNIKATEKLFKVADRDGLYIAVIKTGQICGRFMPSRYIYTWTF